MYLGNELISWNLRVVLMYLPGHENPTFTKANRNYKSNS